jgi:hypothetical protein
MNTNARFLAFRQIGDFYFILFYFIFILFFHFFFVSFVIYSYYFILYQKNMNTEELYCKEFRHSNGFKEAVDVRQVSLIF